MPTLSDVKYFEHTTLDAAVTNKALGGTTLSPYVVPPDMNYIIGFAPSYSSPGSTTGSSGAFASLSGPALKGTTTPVELPMGAFGATLATTHSTPSRVSYIPTSIPVEAGLEINATSTMVGVDTGDGSSQLEIEYSSEPRPGFQTDWHYQVLEAIIAAVDTATGLETAGTVSTFKASVKENFIRQIISAVTTDSSGVGASVSALELTGTGMDQDCIYSLDGAGGTHATEANGHAEARVRNVLTKINGNQPITAKGIFSGADTGNTIFIVGLGFTTA